VAFQHRLLEALLQGHIATRYGESRDAAAYHVSSRNHGLLLFSKPRQVCKAVAGHRRFAGDRLLAATGATI
jgi:hypothetical protein